MSAPPPATVSVPSADAPHVEKDRYALHRPLRRRRIVPMQEMGACGRALGMRRDFELALQRLAEVDGAGRWHWRGQYRRGPGGSERGTVGFFRPATPGARRHDKAPRQPPVGD